MRNHRRLRLAVPASLFLGLVGAAGCGDDGPAEPPPAFAVRLEVVDAQGDPVPGLNLAVSPDSEYYGERALPAIRQPEPPATGLMGPYPNPFYPAVTIMYVLHEDGDVRAVVEDVAGAACSLLWEGPEEAGVHELAWIGRCQDGTLAPSGVYIARLAVRDPADGSLVLDERRPMLLARLNAAGAGIGTTDAQGRITLEDRRLFPYLYDLAPFAARDENGDEIGLIELTPTMRFYLSDPQTGQFMRFDREVTGSATFRFDWTPPA